MEPCPAPLRVVASGLEEHGFPSINRTRAFYERSLAARFALTHLPADAPLPPDAAAVLSFTGSRWWEVDVHPPCPLVFGMHGGPVLDPGIRALASHLETTDVLLVNCTSDEAILADMFGAAAPRLRRLPLPVDTSVFRPFRTPASREVLGLATDGYLLGFVARLVPQKNLHQFLRVLADVRRALAPVPVRGLVIGDYWTDYPVLNFGAATYRDHAARLVDELGLEDAVALSPAGLDDATLALCYGAMDVLVHPTNAIDENFGYAPVEAMACGTPVVGTAYGGLKDTVRHGETGVLAPTWCTPSGIRFDQGVVVDAVVGLLHDDAGRLRAGEAAARWAAEAFDEARCARVLTDAVGDAARDRTAGGGRTVEVRPMPEPLPERSLLPPVEPPWEHYQRAVEHYVSRPVPTLADVVRTSGTGTVRTFGPVEVTGRSHRIDDPAWPATFELDAADAALVARCAQPVTVEALLEGGADPARLDALVAEGLLVLGVTS